MENGFAPAVGARLVVILARRTAARLVKVLKKHGREVDPELGEVDVSAGDNTEHSALAACYAAAAAGTDLFGERAGSPALRRVDPSLARPHEPVAIACGKDGTRAVLLSLFDLCARVCALIPRSGFNMVRYYGCLGSHSALRSEVVPKPWNEKLIHVSLARELGARRFAIDDWMPTLMRAPRNRLRRTSGRNRFPQDNSALTAAASLAAAPQAHESHRPRSVVRPVRPGRFTTGERLYGARRATLSIDRRKRTS